ncbi:hypothetical protein EJ03DRAFT_26545 [Teratosphaeria nubilosa]|uniref:Uncharacterized protein n=1 Tax=Teratosphaeria nubilosa TaxID=161662 RepID=A0A6G1KV47_9PEZI|nr:hypothetical protein EJ03DRAFT_26545 [Teratosphaeria nubilosa]
MVPGLFSSSGTSHYTTCATGNCTFPTHSTLGICSVCEDLSPLLYFSGTEWGFSTDQNNPDYYQFGTSSFRQLLFMRSWAGDYQGIPIVFTGAKNHTVLDLTLMYW